ncbi:dihydroorotate dehydrogenase [Alkalihalobacillus sp. R86527]|uniref:dihydroorotate dehydrogenase n=1 Tax=Alkalihalobacillus sp. R86527 TaxID=3093863 RepID=UPI0036725CE9
MPDWTYHPLFKPWLTRLAPGKSREFIYKSLGLISTFLFGRMFIETLGHLKPPSDIGSTVDGVRYSSPVGISTRLDPIGSGAKSFSSLGISVIEAGPVSHAKNEQRDPGVNREQEEIWFPFPENTQTVEECSKQIGNFGGPAIITIDVQLKGEEIVEVINQLSDVAESFAISIQQAQELKDVTLKKNPNLYVIQTLPSLSVDLLTFLLRSKAVDGVVLEPVKRSNKNYFTEKKGANKSLVEAVQTIRKNVSQTCTLITKGGVSEPGHAKDLFNNGVSICLLEGGYVFAGPGLPKRICELLLPDRLEAQNPQGARYGMWFGITILFAGILALLFSMTRIILPYDEAFLGMTKAEIAAINPQILAFMAHDRMTLAGTMISGGVLYIQLARYGLRNKIMWANRSFHIAAITGFIGIFSFIGYGYFDWLHGLFWLLLLPMYVLCYRHTRQSVVHPGSINETNHYAWRKANYGQLLFVVLGVLISVGGLVIMFIGMTGVFVPTDITFLCMTPDTMQNLNDRLIPVIAHDRAGFGSALVSVGILVLFISLWGFREGESWVWNTLAVGAPPAFLAGIVTHFVIGYTSFFHLLPAYLLVAIYVLGLYFSYPYLKKRGS